MQKVTVNGVLKTEANGQRSWAGYTTESSVEGLLVSPVDMLDLEDGSDERWVLAAPAPVPLLDQTALDDLRAGELRRATIASLTDAQLEALGLTRE